VWPEVDGWCRNRRVVPPETGKKRQTPTRFRAPQFVSLGKEDEEDEARRTVFLDELWGDQNVGAAEVLRRWNSVIYREKKKRKEEEGGGARWEGRG
jgi:hypothetical protein